MVKKFGKPFFDKRDNTFNVETPSGFTRRLGKDFKKSNIEFKRLKKLYGV